MLDDLLTQKTIQVSDRNDLTWQEAIKIAAQPLVDNQSIEESYVNSMIDIANQDGPYFNIGDHVALAHARPEAGSHQIALSLLKTNHDVDLLTKDHPVSLWFVLSAIDSDSHLKVIQGLMQLLMDKDKLQQLMDASDVATIQNIIQA